VIAEIVSCGVGAFCIYRWTRYMRYTWRQYKRTDDIERNVRDAREVAMGPSPFRLTTGADDALTGCLAAADPEKQALCDLGFLPLGDLLYEPPNRPASVVYRALIEPDHNVVAFLSVFVKTETVLLNLASYTDTEVFHARRGAWRTLSDPPFLHRKILAKDASVESLLVEHRALVGSEPLVRIESRAELVAILAKIHERTASWRATQAPDALLEADLRSLLGERYPQAGKTWAGKLRDRLPAATLLPPRPPTKPDQRT
jgi:hypothetical protein